MLGEIFEWGRGPLFLVGDSPLFTITERSSSSFFSTVFFLLSSILLILVFPFLLFPPPFFKLFAFSICSFSLVGEIIRGIEEQLIVWRGRISGGEIARLKNLSHFFFINSDSAFNTNSLFSPIRRKMSEELERKVIQTFKQKYKHTKKTLNLLERK